MASPAWSGSSIVGPASRTSASLPPDDALDQQDLDQPEHVVPVPADDLGGPVVEAI